MNGFTNIDAAKSLPVTTIQRFILFFKCLTSLQSLINQVKHSCRNYSIESYLMNKMTASERNSKKIA